MLDGDILKYCKQGCVFINIGRGDICSEQSMLIYYIHYKTFMMIIIYFSSFKCHRK